MLDIFEIGVVNHDNIKLHFLKRSRGPQHFTALDALTEYPQKLSFVISLKQLVPIETDKKKMIQEVL